MGSYSPLLILVILCDGIKSAEDCDGSETGLETTEDRFMGIYRPLKEDKAEI